MIFFNYSLIGAEHIKNNKECQDYSGSLSFKSRDNLTDDVFVAVVADGHGGNNYIRSSYGSKFAVEATLKVVEEFAKKIDTQEMYDDKHYNILRGLASSILNEWHIKIVEHFKNNKFNEVELINVNEDIKNKYMSLNDSFNELDNKIVHELAKVYGTTLITFVYLNDCCFGLQIGDGRCVAFNKEQEPFEPMPLNEKCFFNKTTSICDSDAIDEFVFYFSKEKPYAVFLGSDGIDDSYSNMEDVYSLYKSMIKAFSTESEEEVKKEIKDYMQEITDKGSGDDVSVALIVSL